MAVEDILRFEGLKLGGSTMGCKRTKKVFSPALGRMVVRCAEFDKGGFSMGALRIPGVDFGQIKDTLITGGVAVGGAVMTGKVVAYIAPLVKLDPESLKPEEVQRSKTWLPVFEIATGIGLGILVTKLTKKPDLGAALAIGPVVVNGLKIVSGILATNNGISGLRRAGLPGRQPLGAVIEQQAFPPEGMYDRQYASEFGQPQAAWAI